MSGAVRATTFKHSLIYPKIGSIFNSLLTAQHMNTNIPIALVNI